MSKNHNALDRRRWSRTRQAVFERDQFTCQVCGKRGRLECAHIKSLATGGAQYDLDNLRTTCRSCHIAEHQKERLTPAQIEWAEFMQELSANSQG